jgi:CRISPR-associated protein Cmr4
MFNATRLVFYYSVSPVHMGAGSAIGAIDSPIQREVHTGHPMLAGSGLKGALRHHFAQSWPGEAVGNVGLVNRIFGPSTNAASDFAGALSLTDAQLVLLPVRSLRNGFAFATSPLALARLKRLSALAGLTPDWQIPDVAENTASVASEALLSGIDDGRRLVLESYEFTSSVDAELAKVADWLALQALGSEMQRDFAAKLRTDLVLLHDTDFQHFARHSMVVEPHVAIRDDTGTADDGKLFYVENLPPESLMAGLMQASVERVPRKHRADHAAEPMHADEVLASVLTGDGANRGIDGRVLQVGGDATTGRGLVVVQAARVQESAA